MTEDSVRTFAQLPAREQTALVTQLVEVFVAMVRAEYPEKYGLKSQAVSDEDADPMPAAGEAHETR